MNKRNKGKIFEEKAEAYLLEKGYQVITRNFQYGHCEIDLIALSPTNVLVFFEIKYRIHNPNFNPLDSISYTKKKNLIQASKGFLTNHKNFLNFYSRYDVIIFISQNGKTQICHLENAFIDEP